MAKILVADDEKKMRHLLSMILEESGHEVLCAEDGEQAFLAVQDEKFDMVVSDIKMPRMDGIALLAAIKEAQIPCPVIFITAFATVDSAVEMMRMGAADYITKPFDMEQIILAVERTLNVSQLLGENRVLKDKLSGIEKKDHIIHKSLEMKELMALATRVAQSESAVLIQGESGTGKELLARFVHRTSSRKDAKFVPVNCAAISSSLVESELFGHEKGAFTGAEKTTKGKFEFASSGTIFLDEIGDLPLDAQAKLLRVLQEKKINRVGGNKEIKVDVRVVCATNKDILHLVKQKKFREDLYYRINVFPLVPPPLRDRKDDIIALAEYFLNQFEHRPKITLKECAKKVLLAYDWPGNVRELANAMERGLILGGDCLALSGEVFSFLSLDGDRQEGRSLLLQLPSKGIDFEKEVSGLVQQAFEKSDGNQSAAARLLGLTRAKYRVLIKQAEDNGILLK